MLTVSLRASGFGPVVETAFRQRATPLDNLVSPKQVARAIGVSESSLKRWCDNGVLPTERTVGGHRRIPISGVLRFIRERGHQLVDPAVVGLAPNLGQGKRTITSSHADLLNAFQVGSQDAALRCLVDLYLNGIEVALIFDDVIAPVFHEVGQLWAEGQLEVFEERRAVEFISGTLFEMTRLLRSPDSANVDRPLAIGGSLLGDPYALAARMANMTVEESGFRTSYLGNGLPLESMGRAIEKLRPDLFWVSVSVIDCEADFVRRWNAVGSVAESAGCHVVVGGRAMTPKLRTRIRFDRYCEGMVEFASHARDVAQRVGDSRHPDRN